MQTYRIKPGRHLDGLGRTDCESRAPAACEVRVAIHAVALNFRDLMVAHGTYPVPEGAVPIPCSDGAGEVIAVGDEVRRFRVGDRVVGSFFLSWLEGAPTKSNTNAARGASVDGVLSQEVTAHEDSFVAAPAHLDYAEAATLACAGVTAWNALFVEGRLKPGDTVLLQGTGGVSIYALQLAKAAGVRTIVTSSSDRKLERARALGAHASINYRSTPDWSKEVLELTGGRGVDTVLDVGGVETLEQSAAATRIGGTIAIIGGLSGFGSLMQSAGLIFNALRLAGIYVGNRKMLEDLGRFMETAAVHPVIDCVFGFDQAREAYAHLESGSHFGKVVIQVRRPA